MGSGFNRPLLTDKISNPMSMTMLMFMITIKLIGYATSRHVSRPQMTSNATTTKPSLKANRLVLPCAARSFQYASSISSYARPLADADSLASSLSRSNSDDRPSNSHTVR